MLLEAETNKYCPGGNDIGAISNLITWVLIFFLSDGWHLALQDTWPERQRGSVVMRIPLHKQRLVYPMGGLWPLIDRKLRGRGPWDIIPR
jgi:hypothetical protein